MPDISRPVGPSSPVGGNVPPGQTNEAQRPAGQSTQQTSTHQLSSAPRSNGSDRMSQLRAKLPKLDTGGKNSPASPTADGFKTALSSPTSSVSGSPTLMNSTFSASAKNASGTQTPDTPMSTHNLVAPGGPGGPGGPRGPGGGGGGDGGLHPASNMAGAQAGDATQVMQQMYAQQHQMMLQEVQMKLATSVDSMVSKAADAVGSRIRGAGDGMKEAAR